MNDNILQLFGSIGADDEITEAVKLACAGYKTSHCQKFADIIAGTNTQKDSAIYELCHLIYAISELGYSGQKGALHFFMDKHTGNAPHAQHYIQKLTLAQTQQNYKSADCTIQYDKVKKQYNIYIKRPNQHDFIINAGRIATLSLLFNFLTIIETSKPCDWFLSLCDMMVEQHQIKNAISDISRIFREYRHNHIAYAREEEKFNPIRLFLKEQDKSYFFDDDDIKSFWSLHYHREGFKEYKNTFMKFMDFALFMVEAQFSTSNTEDFDMINEHDIINGTPSWQNILDVFQQDDVASIKFFKDTELKILKNLMALGQVVKPYYLSLMRAEIFGYNQTSISQAMRKKMDIAPYVYCQNITDDYQTYIQHFEAIYPYIKKLQLVIYYYIQDDITDDTIENIDSINHNEQIEGIKAQAQQVLKTIHRKNFDKIAQLDYEILSTIGDRLVKMQNIIEYFMKWHHKQIDFLQKTATDKEFFIQQFTTIYLPK